MNKTLYKDYSGENKNFVIEIKNGNSWTTLYSVNSEVLTTGSITVEIKQKDVQNIISKTDKVTFRFKAKNNGEWCYSNEFTVTWSDILFTQQPQNKTAYIGQNVNVEFMVDHDVIGKDSIALWEFNGTTWNNLRIYSPYSVKANTPATITIKSEWGKTGTEAGTKRYRLEPHVGGNWVENSVSDEFTITWTDGFAFVDTIPDQNVKGTADANITFQVNKLIKEADIYLQAKKGDDWLTTNESHYTDSNKPAYSDYNFTTKLSRLREVLGDNNVDEATYHIKFTYNGADYVSNEFKIKWSGFKFIKQPADIIIKPDASYDQCTIMVNKAITSDSTDTDSKNLKIEYKKGNTWEYIEGYPITIDANTDKLIRFSVPPELKNNKATLRIKLYYDGEWYESDEFTITWTDFEFIKQPTDMVVKSGEVAECTVRVNKDLTPDPESKYSLKVEYKSVKDGKWYVSGYDYNAIPAYTDKTLPAWVNPGSRDGNDDRATFRFSAYYDGTWYTSDEFTVIWKDRAISVPTAKTGLVYNGNEQIGVEAGQGYTLEGTAKATNAGKYTVTAKLNDGYVWSDGSTDDKEIDWEIARQYVARPTLPVKEFEYTGELIKIKDKFVGFDGNKMNITDDDGVSVGGYNTIVEPRENYTFLTESDPEWAGEYENYNWRIIKGTPKYELPTDLTGKEGDKLSTVALPTAKNGTWTWNEPETVMSKTGEQKFTATFTPNDINNYNVVKNVEITVNVTAKEIKIAIPTGKTGLVFNDTTQIGVKAGKGYTLTGEVEGRNAAKYEATAKLENGYVWADGTKTDKVIKWEIAKKSVSLPTLRQDKFTYGHDILIEGHLDGFTSTSMLIVSGGDLTRAVGKYSTTVATKDNYKFVENGKEVASKEYKWEIVKADPEYTLPDNLTGKVGDAISTVKLPDGFEWENPNAVMDEAGNKTFTSKFTPEDTNNYNVVEGIKITVNVINPNPAKPTIEVTGEYTYTGSKQTATVTGYDEATMDITGNTGTNAGDYTVEVTSKTGKWAGGSTDAVTAAWKILKADPKPEMPENLEGKKGDALSTVKLPDGFAWKDSTIVMEEAGKHKFKATFTPEDTDNYNVMEGIEITVNVTENIPDTYKITVEGGKADYTEAEEGTTVTITANVPDDKKFVNWTSEDGVEFADATAEETTFKMLGKAVTVTANLEDKEAPQTVEKPAFSPNGGKFTDSVEVSILCATQGAAIYYTTDGETWNEYTEPFTITETTTVKAYAAKDGFDNSDKVSATFTKVEDTTDEVTVTFDSNGGSKVAKQTIEKGAKAEKPSNPKRSGYTFRGWYEDEDLKTKYDFSQPVNEDITLYARWRRSSGSSSSSSGTAVTYKVVIDDTENGAAESDKETASKNTTVTITVKPDKDYEIRKVKVVDSNNNEIKLTDKGDGTYTFTMPASKVYVKATFKEAEKTDVKPEVKTDVIKMTIGDIVMTLNDKAFYNDVAPVIVDNRTMVPIRVITEMFGGTADWNEETKEVTLTIDGKVIKMTVGVVLEEYGTAPAIISDRTFVPVRFVADELGAETSWDDATKTVTITKAVAE